MKIGCHVGIAGGLEKAVARALERGCDTIQIFLSAPLAWKGSDAIREDLAAFGELARAQRVCPVFIHAIYLVNPATSNPEVLKKSKAALTAGMISASIIGPQASLVTHLGSHLGRGEAAGMKRALETIREVFSDSPGGSALLLENAAGSGDTLGRGFRELGTMVREVGHRELGICFDTCHGFASGYDLRNEAAVDKTLAEFDREIGMERLRMIHANDSVGALGSGLDRHAPIGKGEIGMEGFRAMLANRHLRSVPWILEVPHRDAKLVRDQIAMLKKMSETKQSR